MGFATASDPFIAAAFWIGCGAFATTGLLLVAVAAMRARLLRRRRRDEAVARFWNPRIAECAERIPDPIPLVDAEDAVAFLTLWCRAQELLRGRAQQRVTALGEIAGARKLARGLLGSGNVTQELLAIIVLGHLKDHEVAPLLAATIPVAPSVTSLCAAQALLRIDAVRGLPPMLAAAAARDDWPLARVSALLKEIDPARVGPPLADAIAAESGAGRARLLRLHGSAPAEMLRPAILKIFAGEKEDEVLSAALGALWHPEDAGIARRLCGHSQWTVRVAAVRALSRVGTPADAPLLARLLSDEAWWVRYRAAETLCALSTPAALEALRAGITDRFAADMLRQAVADRAAI